jgi:hypothetical protein
VFGVAGLANTGRGMDAMLPEPFDRGYVDSAPEMPDDQD